MLTTMILAFVSGFFAGNGLPYFVIGSFGEEHQYLLGKSAASNLLAGWIALVIAGVCWYYVNDGAYPVVAWGSGAAGALVVGLIHAKVWKTNKPMRRNTQAR